MTQVTFEESYYKTGNKKTGTYQEYDFEKYVSYYAKMIPFLKTHVKSGGRVLDLGCARGSSTYALRQAGFDARGIDVSKHAVESAPDSVRSHLSVADLNDWEPHGDLFNTVLCFGVLEYLRDMNKALIDLSWSLKHDGWLFIKTLSSTSKQDRLRVSCLPPAHLIKNAAHFGLEHDPAVSAEFREKGMRALHEFSLEHPDSVSKKVYYAFHAIFGDRLSMRVLESMNKNLEFLAFRKT